MFFGDLTHTAQLVHYWGSWVATRMLIYWHWWQHRCHQLIFRRLICSRSTRPSTSRRPVPFLRNFNPWLQLIFKNGIYVLAVLFYSILYPAVPLCWQGRWREVGKSGSASRQDPSGQLWFRKKKLAVIRGLSGLNPTYKLWGYLQLSSKLPLLKWSLASDQIWLRCVSGATISMSLQASRQVSNGFQLKLCFSDASVLRPITVGRAAWICSTCPAATRKGRRQLRNSWTNNTAAPPTGTWPWHMEILSQSKPLWGLPCF